MRATTIAAALLIWLFAAWGPVCAQAPPDIVLQWAPLVYEKDEDDVLNSLDDVFTVVNFDHDWRAKNNWYNLAFYPPDMALYYSLLETETHFYIGYYFYFPRHMVDDEFGHYLTGVLAVVSKGPGVGQLDGLVTFKQNNLQWVDGSKMRYDGGRFALAISDAAHDLRVIGQTQSLPAYAPLPPLPAGSEGQAAARRTGRVWSHAAYRLVALDELWDRRQDIGFGRTFGRWGYLDGAGKVGLPWVWEYKKLNWLAQPAELVRAVQGIKSGDAVVYPENPYQELLRR